MQQDRSASSSAVKQLAELFGRNGYVRRQNAARIRGEGWQRYKKGDEVRLVASSRSELQLIRRLLCKSGFKPGRPFAKGRQFRQPLYGREAVARFLALVGPAKRRRRPNRAAAGDRRHGGIR